MARAAGRGSWLWRGAAVAWMLLMFGLSSRPDIPDPFDLAELLPADKIAHFGLFAVLAGLLYLSGLRALLAVAAAGLYGVSDEIHQMFVPGRSPDVRDWLADVSGAVVGVWFVRFAGWGQEHDREPVE